MKLPSSVPPLPCADISAQHSEVAHLRRGLAALRSEPSLISEVAVCLAYLSLGEQGRAGLAQNLVEEFHEELAVAAARLNPPRQLALKSLLQRIEVIAQIQDTRSTLHAGMAFRQPLNGEVPSGPLPFTDASQLTSAHSRLDASLRRSAPSALPSTLPVPLPSDRMPQAEIPFDTAA